MNFAERLRELRKVKGVTQEQVANTLGLSTRTYSHYELGDREPCLAVLVMICGYFEVTADYLLGMTDY